MTAQSTSDLSPKHQTSEISVQKFRLMWNHQKWQHWGGKPNFMRLSLDKAVRHICYVVKAVL